MSHYEALTEWLIKDEQFALRKTSGRTTFAPASEEKKKTVNTNAFLERMRELGLGS